jgi:hypothetical protein
MLKKSIGFIVLMVIFSQQSYAGNWKPFNASVERIASAVDVGVTRARFFELLADAADKSRGICESIEQAKTANNWYCVAYWQFRTVGLSWYAEDKPDKQVIETAMGCMKQARKTGGPVKK